MVEVWINDELNSVGLRSVHCMKLGSSVVLICISLSVISPAHSDLTSKLVCLIPFSVGGLVVDVGSNISDLVIIETTTECGHSVLSVGHLC